MKNTEDIKNIPNLNSMTKLSELVNEIENDELRNEFLKFFKHKICIVQKRAVITELELINSHYTEEELFDRCTEQLKIELFRGIENDIVILYDEDNLKKRHEICVRLAIIKDC